MVEVIIKENDIRALESIGYSLIKNENGTVVLFDEYHQEAVFEIDSLNNQAILIKRDSFDIITNPVKLKCIKNRCSTEMKFYSGEYGYLIYSMKL